MVLSDAAKAETADDRPTKTLRAMIFLFIFKLSTYIINSDNKIKAIFQPCWGLKSFSEIKNLLIFIPILLSTLCFML